MTLVCVTYAHKKWMEISFLDKEYQIENEAKSDYGKFQIAF